MYSPFECPHGATETRTLYLLTPPVPKRSIALASSARRTTSAVAEITARSKLRLPLAMSNHTVTIKHNTNDNNDNTNSTQQSVTLSTNTVL